MSAPCFYVASGLENAAEARRIAETLAARGWTLTYAWWTHGSVQAEGESRIREVAINEMDGVCRADYVLVMLPGGRGTHTEMGAAIALGKGVVLLATPEQLCDASGRECAFYRHPLVAIESDEAGLLQFIEIAEAMRETRPLRALRSSAP